MESVIEEPSTMASGKVVQAKITSTSATKKCTNEANLKQNTQEKISFADSTIPVAPAHILENPALLLDAVDVSLPFIDNLLEFRFEILQTSSLLPDCEASNRETIFDPGMGSVFTLIESVVHYSKQPVYVYINGRKILSYLPTPVALHICISMDNGQERYEEVIRLKSIQYPYAPFIHGQPCTFSSVEYRVKRGDPNRKPKFRDILKRSLQETVKANPNGPTEMIISRATGRAVHMDSKILEFLNTSTEPFDIYMQAIIEHIQQTVAFKLSGVNYTLTGRFYRPVQTHATVHTCSGNTQLFETVSLVTESIENHQVIYASSHDSAFGLKIAGEGNRIGLRIVDAVSYMDFGPAFWGPQLIGQNPRVPIASHPFYNLCLNPTFNTTYNPFMSKTFMPPKGFVFPTTSVAPDVLLEDGVDKINSIPVLPQPNVLLFIPEPSFNGPEEIYVSELLTDSEDVYK